MLRGIEDRTMAPTSLAKELKLRIESRLDPLLNGAHICQRYFNVEVIPT